MTGETGVGFVAQEVGCVTAQATKWQIQGAVVQWIERTVLIRHDAAAAEVVGEQVVDRIWVSRIGDKDGNRLPRNPQRDALNRLGLVAIAIVDMRMVSNTYSSIGGDVYLLDASAYGYQPSPTHVT